MKNKRRFLFRAGAVALLVLIAALMFVIGRGHTVYFDNKTLEYQGQAYEAPYRISVYVNDEQVAKLGKRERGMSPWMGQNFRMLLEVTKEKGGETTAHSVRMPLPYNMDGIILNLPAMLAGLPPEAYLSEFVQTAEPEAPEDESVVTDEFSDEAFMEAMEG